MILLAPEKVDAKDRETGEWPLSRMAIIARVAGLGIDEIRPFSSPACATALDALEALERELTQARQQMADRLFEAIPSSTTPTRRIFLKARRNCHNNRSIANYQKTETWQELLRASGGLAENILNLEGRLESRMASFNKLFEEEIRRENQQLLSLAEDPKFSESLSFASPALAAQLSRLDSSSRPLHARKKKKLAFSLIRYASRAVLKLSPNSTLTPIGVAKAVEGTGRGQFPRFVGQQMPSEKSILRVPRSRLDQLGTALTELSSVRRQLQLRLNPSCDFLDSGAYQFLRPGRWKIDSQKLELSYQISAVQKAPITSPVLKWCLENLAQAPMKFSEMLAQVLSVSEESSDELIEAELESLLESGILEWQLPWGRPGLDIENELADFLDSLPEEEWTQSAREALRKLVALENGNSDLAKSRWAEQATSLFNEAWQSVPSASPHRYIRGPGLDLFEDVILAPADGHAGDPVLEVPAGPIQKALENLRPWYEISVLYGHRMDFVLTLTAHLRACCEGRSQVSALEAFQLALPLWKEYRRLTGRLQGGSGGWTQSFNPLEIPAVAELAELKRGIFEDLLRLTSETADPTFESDGLQFMKQDLARIASRIPIIYRPHIGPCLQMQATNPQAEAWILNRLFAGTGRFSSRFAPFMDEIPKRRFLDRLVRNSSFENRGETVHLLDLMSRHGSNPNSHDVQTQHVLLLPGEGFTLPSPLGVDLRDLGLDFGGNAPFCRLVDTKGRRFMPAHLGGLASQLMPPIVQFLSLFGPDEVTSVLPPMRPRNHQGYCFLPRLTVGNVVLRRARWYLTEDSFAREIETLTGPLALKALDRFRRRLGLPERVFIIERVSSRVPGGVYKPQFLDLTSPHFVELLRSVLKDQPQLTFEEALPDVTDYPSKSSHNTRAIEIQIDACFTPMP